MCTPRPGYQLTRVKGKQGKQGEISTDYYLSMLLQSTFTDTIKGFLVFFVNLFMLSRLIPVLYIQDHSILCGHNGMDRIFVHLQ